MHVDLTKEKIWSTLLSEQLGEISDNLSSIDSLNSDIRRSLRIIESILYGSDPGIVLRGFLEKEEDEKWETEET